MPLDADDRYRPQRLPRRLGGPIFGVACFLATAGAMVILAVMLGSLIASAMGRASDHPEMGLGGRIMALGRFLWNLALQTPDIDPATAGFRTGIISTLWLLVLTALFAIPTGVGAAVFLEEYVPQGRFRRFVQMNIANLAGVPSIVFGILGLAVFVRAFGFNPLAVGYSLWAGALTLSLLVLPVIVIATQEALRTVPNSLRQAALALGATRWQMVRDHVLPSALPGILTGVILSLSRAIGETAPVLIVSRADSVLTPPAGPGDDYAALPVEIYNYARQPIGSGFETVAAGGILILLLILLTMNATAILIRYRASRNPRA